MPWEYLKAKLNTFDRDNDLKVSLKREGSKYKDDHEWKDSSVLGEQDWELVNVVETQEHEHVGIFKRFRQSREDIDL